MLKKLKSIVLSFAIVSGVALPALAFAPVAFAQVNITNSLCAGSNFNVSTTGSGSCPTSASVSSFNSLLAEVINVFSAIVGVVAVIMIIVGGFRYITSGGDAGKVGTAKTTILYAIIGLIIVALAQLVVHFVLNQTANFAANG